LERLTRALVCTLVASVGELAMIVGPLLLSYQVGLVWPV